MQLYLVKETVLHRLGKARTEWQEAMNEQQFDQLLDSIVPGPKLLFQDTARSYCRIFWRSYNESSLAAGYHCQEEEWRRKVLRLHVQWNCCRRVLSCRCCLTFGSVSESLGASPRLKIPGHPTRALTEVL